MGSGKYRCPARWACGDNPRRFVAGVQMRCRECAAEVAHGSGVPWCGAPIVGQPPVVADTVVADTWWRTRWCGSDTAVSDAAGKAYLPVAGKALREPYVPGSGDRVPAELRLVLAGYVGIACGLFAGALACAAAAVFFLCRPCRRTRTTFERLLSLCRPTVYFWVRGGGRVRFRPVSGFPGCSGGPAIHTGHGDRLEAWPTHPDTRHHPRGRRRSPVPAPVRGSPRVVDEGQHAGTR